MSRMSISRSRSNTAPSSEGRARQSTSAASHDAPFGAKSRPFSQAKVVSSGATMPIFAPISIDRLHRVRRPSTDSARTAEPAYSTA